VAQKTRFKFSVATRHPPAPNPPPQAANFIHKIGGFILAEFATPKTYPRRIRNAASLNL